MANEVKHTPGPWRIQDAGAYSGNVIRFEIVAGPDDDTFEVCEIEDSAAICYDDQDPQDERKAAENRDLANARLIAAAPELLDALEAVVSVLESSLIHKAVPIQYAEAKAAIAKAKGGA